MRARAREESDKQLHQLDAAPQERERDLVHAVRVHRHDQRTNSTSRPASRFQARSAVSTGSPRRTPNARQARSPSESPNLRASGYNLAEPRASSSPKAATPSPS